MAGKRARAPVRTNAKTTGGTPVPLTTAGKRGVVFWVGLGFVVAVLLVVLARLLPKLSVPPGL